MSVWKQLYEKGYIKVKDHKPYYTSKGKKMVRDLTKRRYKRGEITQSEMLKTISQLNFPADTTSAPPAELVPAKPTKPTAYEILASGTTQAVKDKSTGNIVGYLSTGNVITDIHGTAIGTYKDGHATLETLIPVPKRKGIPYCEERNYEKAQKYLWELQEKGEVPGGVTLVQTPEGWKYKMPEKGKALVKLDTGDWVYREGYAKLTPEQQDYLNKYGVDAFLGEETSDGGWYKGYIPVQTWLAENVAAKLKPYLVESEVPEGITNPAFVNYIQGLSGYNLVKAIQDKVLPDRVLEDVFGKETVAKCKKEASLSSDLASWKAKQHAEARVVAISNLPFKERLKVGFTKPGVAMGWFTESIEGLRGFTAKTGAGKTHQIPTDIATALTEAGAYITLMPGMLLQDILTTKYKKNPTYAYFEKYPASKIGVPNIAVLEKGEQLAAGSVLFWVSMPKLIKERPLYGSTLAISLLAGGEAISRIKTGRLLVDPWGTPARTIGGEWSSGRAYVGRLSKADLGNAMLDASVKIMKGDLEGTVTVGNVKLGYRGVPLQHTFGDLLFHASPDVSYFLEKGTRYINEGGLYPSVSASQRFLAGGAKGTIPIKNPGIIAILTDAGKIQRVPSSALKGASRSDWFIRQAHEGFWGPSKIWKHAFESEIPAAPGTALTRAPKTLRSRILGTKAGDLLTQYTGPDVPGLAKGSLIPIYFFLDKGVYKTPPSPALVYAAKLIALRETLKDYAIALKHPKRTIKDIRKGRVGTKGVREFEVSRIRETAELAVKLTKKARKTAVKVAKEKSLSYDEAFRRELVRAFEAERTRIYRAVTPRMERAYKANPRKYEDLYRDVLERSLRRTARIYTIAQARVDITRGVTRGIPTRYKRDIVARRPTFTRTGIIVPRAYRGGEKRKLPKIERGIITTGELVTIPHKRTILLPSGKKLSLTKKQWEGIIAWKQGIMYKMIYPPYGADDIVNSRKTLAGVKYYSGAGSAYKSVIAKGGVVPREVLRDMGIMDLRFRTTRPTSKKPKLFYKRDIKQRTTITPGITKAR